MWGSVLLKNFLDRPTGNFKEVDQLVMNFSLEKCKN